MNPQIATLVCLLGIVALFTLNRDPEIRTSGALWLPVVWLALEGSRTVSQWSANLGFGSGVQVTPEQYLEGSPLDRNVYLALTILAIFILLKRHLKMGPLLRANGPILLFFLYCAVSTTWSDFPDVAFKRWTKTVGDLAMVLVVLTDSEQMAAINRLISRVGFVLLPLSILFIKYYPDLGRGYTPEGLPEYVGVTTGKNLLGMTVLVLGLGSVWCFLQGLRHPNGTRKRGPLIAHGVLFAMAVWLFWMVDSATSLSCFVMASCFIVALSLHRFSRKRWVVHILAAAIVAVSLFALFADSGGGLLGTLGRNQTLTGRTDIWKLVLSMHGNPLIGTGFESFWLGERLQRVWNLYRFHLNEAHNGYIEVYLNLGWAGVSLLGMLIVTGYRNAVAAFRRDPDLGTPKLAYLIVAVVYNLTESAFRILNPIWIFFLLAITTVPEALTPEPPPQIGIDLRNRSSEPAPQIEHVFGAKFCGGTD